jgi:hypothetical protein
MLVGESHGCELETAIRKGEMKAPGFKCYSISDLDCGST